MDSHPPWAEEALGVCVSALSPPGAWNRFSLLQVQAEGSIWDKGDSVLYFSISDRDLCYISSVLLQLHDAVLTVLGWRDYVYV